MSAPTAPSGASASDEEGKSQPNIEPIPTRYSVSSEPSSPSSEIVALCKVFMQSFTEVVKSWHNTTDHISARASMMKEISILLKQHRPNPTEDGLGNIDIISTQIDKRLYSAAESIEEYLRQDNLVVRIQGLAKDFISDTTTTDLINEATTTDLTDETTMTTLPEETKSPSGSTGMGGRNAREGTQVSSQGCSRGFIVKGK